MGLEGIDTRKHTDEAKAIGTLTHYLVECDMRGVEPDLKDYTPAQVERSSFSIQTWTRFKQGKELKPILIEGRLVSEAHRFGGTVDLYGLLNGKANANRPEDFGRYLPRAQGTDRELRKTLARE